MKNRNKIILVWITMAAVFCMTGFTAHAAATDVFDGFKVTVLSNTTPAVSVKGRSADRSVMCFISASGEEVGAVSYSDYNAIIKKNMKVVSLPGGGTYGAPPVAGKSWEAWFAQMYNEYRGVGAETGSAADEVSPDETILLYRNEIVRLVNLERENAGLSALYADEKAMEYAGTRAEELATSYSHTRPDGKKKPYDELGAINENIAKGQQTPAEVMRDWMNSPSHRSNILSEDAFAIGVGCYSNGGSFHWSQEFLW